MGLSAYTSPDITALIDSHHPLTFTFDGRYGGIQDKCIFLRNDNANLWYDNIVVSIIDTGSPIGTSCKMLERDTPPVFEMWRDIVPGASIAIIEGLGTSQFADIVTFLPLWVRIEVPSRLTAQNIISISLSISSQEHLVSG